jgi:hypothetical protein
MEQSRASSDSPTDPSLAFDLDGLAVPSSPHDGAKPGGTDPWGINVPPPPLGSDSVSGTSRSLWAETVEAAQQTFEPEPRAPDWVPLKPPAEAQRLPESHARIVTTAAAIAAATRTRLHSASNAAAWAIANVRADTLVLRREHPTWVALFTYAMVGIAMFGLGRLSGLPATVKPLVEKAPVVAAVESANADRVATAPRPDSAAPAQAVAPAPTPDLVLPVTQVPDGVVPTVNAPATPPSAPEPRPADEVTAGPPFRGSLAVTSFPSGAQVFVNGVVVGTTPLSLRNLPVGSRAMRLVRDGYEPWFSTVQIVANQRASTVAQLKPLRRAN